MKTIFVIDWVLIPSFIFSVVTGIGLHVAGHGSCQESWQDWAVAHVVASSLFTICVLAHIKSHRGWYKSLFRNGAGRKSRVTVAVSILFALVTLTGYGLLGIKGSGSGIGLWHYRMGLLSLILFGGHVMRRLSVLRGRSTTISR